MDRRSFLRTLGLSACAGRLLAGRAAWAETRPNFLFIIADDCTFRDIGCYGGQAHTPHIDQLAQEGLRFTQCFQAAPMCSPTRHNIYTGLYPVKSGAYPNHTFVKPGVQSVVQYLQPAGYHCALAGKRHIAPESAFPFEYLDKQKNPDLTAIDAFLGKRAAQQEPFCLFACSNEPHTPWDKGDPDRYPPEAIKVHPYFVDTPTTRKSMQRYLAEITYFDQQVGDCLALLDKHQLTENTLVMVVSEQGSSLPFGKWTCYDTGLQSAMLVRWPGRVAPGTTDAMVEYVDVLPTFLAAAGLTPPAQLDGKSFLSVLEGKAATHKEYVYGEMTTRGINNGADYYGSRSIRSRDFKYIWNFTPEATFHNGCVSSETFHSWKEKAKTDAWAAARVKAYQHRPAEELYAIREDPFELKNLAADPAYAAEKQDLRARLETWMKAMGDEGQATEMAALDHVIHLEKRKAKMQRK